MLTNIFLVGLIPGLMATPILTRPDATTALSQPAAISESNSTSAAEPAPTASDCGCGAACEGEKNVAAIIKCVNDCLEACDLDSIKGNGRNRRDLDPRSYPVRPGPAAPSHPVAAPVPSGQHAVSTFPVSPLPSSGSAVPPVAPSPHPQPLHTLPTRPVEPQAATPKPQGPWQPQGDPPKDPARPPWGPPAGPSPAGPPAHPPWGPPSGPSQPPAGPPHPQHHYSVQPPPAGHSDPAWPHSSQAPAGTHQAQPPHSAQHLQAGPSDPAWPPSSQALAGANQAQPTHSTQHPPAGPSHPTQSYSSQPPAGTHQAQPPHSAQQPPAGAHPAQSSYSTQPPHSAHPPAASPSHQGPPHSPPRPAGPPPGPGAASFVSADARCAQNCNIECQHADIALEVSQCRSKCIAACSSGSASKVSASGSLPGHPPVRPGAPKGLSAVPKGKGVPPVVAVDSSSYEACLKACKSKSQHADIALDVSQGEIDCKSACAGHTSSQVGILNVRTSNPEAGALDKRESLDARTASAYDIRSKKHPKPQPGPALATDATSYEACLSDCHAKWQHAGTALNTDTGKGSCKTACAKYASASAGILDKKDTAESASEDSIEARSKKHPKPPPGPAFATDATSYEACLSDCHAKWQHAGTALNTDTGKGSCKTACARYSSAGAGFLDKKDAVETPSEDSIESRSKKHPKPPPGPAFGTHATSYEACLSDCRSKSQHADIAFDVSQGKTDCKAACARYSSAGVDILDKKDTVEAGSEESRDASLDSRTLKHHKPGGPALGTHATTYEACLSDCHSKYQHTDIALGVSQGKTDCKAACAKYASAGTKILDKKDTNTEAEIDARAEGSLDSRSKKHPKPQPGPAFGVHATNYEACLSDCNWQYQSADLAAGVSQGKTDCKAACAKYSSAGTSILDKKDTGSEEVDARTEALDARDAASLDTRSKHHKPPAPAVSTHASSYQACLTDCRSKSQHADIALDVSQGETDCKSACARYSSAGVGVLDKKDGVPNTVESASTPAEVGEREG